MCYTDFFWRVINTYRYGNNINPFPGSAYQHFNFKFKPAGKKIKSKQRLQRIQAENRLVIGEFQSLFNFKTKIKKTFNKDLIFPKRRLDQIKTGHNIMIGT